MSTPDQKIAAAAGKAPLWLIAWRCLLGVARVFAYGAKKYKPGNWHEATLADGAAERYISAASRHLLEMQGSNGLFTRESLAAIDESGLPHIDHALCSLIMLRGILIKDGVLPADPGEGKPPARDPARDAVIEDTKIRVRILKALDQHGVIISGQTPAERAVINDMLEEGTIRRVGSGIARNRRRCVHYSGPVTKGGRQCDLPEGHGDQHSSLGMLWRSPEPLPKGPLSWDDVNAHHERPTPPAVSSRCPGCPGEDGAPCRGCR